MKAGQSSERRQYQFKFKYWIYSAQLECWNLPFFGWVFFRVHCAERWPFAAHVLMMFLRLLNFKENKTELFKRFSWIVLQRNSFFFTLFVKRCGFLSLRWPLSSTHIKFVCSALHTHTNECLLSTKSNIVLTRDSETKSSNNSWWNVSKRRLRTTVKMHEMQKVNRTNCEQQQSDTIYTIRLKPFTNSIRIETWEILWIQWIFRSFKSFWDLRYALIRCTSSFFAKLFEKYYELSERPIVHLQSFSIR